MSQKELFKIKLEQQLKEWDNKLLLLKEEALQNKNNNKVNLKLNDQIEKLQRKLDEGKEKLVRLQHTTEESWQIVKEGAEATWELFKMQMEKLLTQITQKSAGK